MKKLFTIALFTCLGLQAFSQQDVYFSQFFNNKLNINPAFAGIDKSYNAAIMGRDQWTAYPGNPSTLMFAGDAYLPCINSGIGLTAYRNGLGFETNSEVKLSYSKHLIMGSGTLSMGASIGYYSTSLTSDWLTFGANPLVTVAKTNMYDIGLGLYYTNEQGFYLSFSASHAPEKILSSNTTFQPYTPPAYYSFMTGYTCAVSSNWDIIPEVLFQSYQDYSNTQISLRAQYNKTLWFGLGYQQNNSYSILIGFNIFTKDLSTLKLGYSYSFISPQPTQFTTSGIHELMLQFSLKQKPKAK